MERVATQRGDIKLVFLGIRHPNPDVGGDEMANRAVALSQELGLHETCVFFREWTPYRERQAYLLEADVGISLHFAHVETHFSFRTRLLDHIWAELPTIVTRGDVLSDLVEQHELGWVVDYESVDEVAAAILESAGRSRDEFRKRFAEVVPQLAWDAVMQPLLTFCREPRPAPDRDRARSSLQSMPMLKLTSHMSALQRELGTLQGEIETKTTLLHDRGHQIATLEQQVHNWSKEVDDLRTAMAEIEQGRVMRLMNAISRAVKGSPPR
jgi:hypothetical protein